MKNEICRCCGKEIETGDECYINPNMDEEFVLCWDCKNDMMDDNEIDLCVGCGCYVSSILVFRDDDLQPYGDFDECPICHQDILEGYTKIELRTGNY